MFVVYLQGSRNNVQWNTAEYTPLLEIFLGFCKNIAWKKKILRVALCGCQSFYRDTRIHMYVCIFFFCYQHFARVSLIGILVVYLWGGFCIYMRAQNTHTHGVVPYIRRQPHSYNALSSTVITAHNKTNYCFLISPTEALLPLSLRTRVPYNCTTPRRRVLSTVVIGFSTSFAHLNFLHRQNSVVTILCIQSTEELIVTEICTVFFFCIRAVNQQFICIIY